MEWIPSAWDWAWTELGNRVKESVVPDDFIVTSYGGNLKEWGMRLIQTCHSIK